MLLCFYVRLRPVYIKLPAVYIPSPCPAGDRHQLWEEKVGLVQPFAGNAATEWGTSAEPRALATYEAVTGQRIASCMFQGVLRG